MDVLIGPGSSLFLVLQWNDQFGASGNDYDMLIVDETEENLLCSECASALLQSGFQDPGEAICYFNDTSNVVRGKIAIHKFGGVDLLRPRRKRTKCAHGWNPCTGDEEARAIRSVRSSGFRAGSIDADEQQSVR